MLVNLKHILAHKWQKNQIIFQDRFYFPDSPHPQGEEAGDLLSVKEYTDNGFGKVLKLNWIPKISQRTSSTKFREHDTSKIILFQNKVFGKRIKGTTLLKIIRQTNWVQYILRKWNKSLHKKWSFPLWISSVTVTNNIPKLPCFSINKFFNFCKFNQTTKGSHYTKNEVFHWGFLQ